MRKISLIKFWEEKGFHIVEILFTDDSVVSETFLNRPDANEWVSLQMAGEIGQLKIYSEIEARLRRAQ